MELDTAFTPADLNARERKEGTNAVRGTLFGIVGSVLLVGIVSLVVRCVAFVQAVIRS
ncbi:hypothetical protein [Rathayibacter rathayi]|uniref:hypothetical protein n=1 Tax=Rathayibacter rathayi TaxID=33887 RepID=UPI0015E3570F|nr:hypothetical protein [Rathayibacter rathayi]